MESGNGRVTFSITGLSDDLVGSLYWQSKRLGVKVASVFRHNLGVLEDILTGVEEGLADGKREQVESVIEALSLSHIPREEGLPTVVAVCRHLSAMQRPDLIPTVESADTLLMALIVDRARKRAHVAAEELADVEAG